MVLKFLIEKHSEQLKKLKMRNQSNTPLLFTATDVYSCWRDEEVTCSNKLNVGAELWLMTWEMCSKICEQLKTVVKRGTNHNLIFSLQPLLLVVVCHGG